MHENLRLLELFIDSLVAEKGASANTVAAYRTDLLQFFDFCDCVATDIEPEDVAAFIQDLSIKGIEKSSISRKYQPCVILVGFYLQKK